MTHGDLTQANNSHSKS